MSVADRFRNNPIFTLLFAIIAIVLAYFALNFIGTLVGAIFIYYAVRPIYHRLDGYTKYNSIIAIASVLALLIPVFALLGYTGLIAYDELRLYSSELARIINTQVGPDPLKIVREANPERISTVIRAGLEYIGVVGTLILHFTVSLSLVFYFLRDGEQLHNWVVTVFDNTGILKEYIARIDRDLEQVFFGNLLHAVLIGLFAAIVYNALNIISPPGVFIPFPTLLGILTGMSSIIPVLGLKVVYAPIAGYLGWQSYLAGLGETGWFPAMFLGIALTFIDGIPDVVIRGYVSGRRIHVGLMIFSYVFGALLFGWYGLFLGPVIMVTLYHFATYVVPQYLNPDAQTTLTDH